MKTAADITSTRALLFCVACQLASITLSVTSSRSWTPTRDNNVLQERTCAEQLRHIYTDDVIAEVPPRVTGLWASQSCETRPGPEYVLRQYRFYDGGLFDLRLFHYADPDCRNTTFSVSARGRYQFYQSSWIVPGSAETDYQLRLAGVVPYTTRAADVLHRKLNGDGTISKNDTRSTTNIDDRKSKACAEVIGDRPWPLFERREVYSCFENDNEDDGVTDGASGGLDPEKIIRSRTESRELDLDCLDLIESSFHELQLMRVEQRRLPASSRNNASSSNDVIRTLFLGDVHTDRQQRQFYRPMGFQEPLVLHESPGCNKVCDVVARANDHDPPILPAAVGRAARERSAATGSTLTAATVALRLIGSWASARCETRSYGVFLTRHIDFFIGAVSDTDDASADSTVNRKRKWNWSSRHGYFGDVLCRRAAYAVETSGTYQIDHSGSGGRADVKTATLVEHVSMVDTFNIEFNVTKIALIVYDKRLVRQLNHLRTCGDTSPRTQWRVGERHDVTSTSGCAAIGVHVSSSESDIVRLVASSPSSRGPSVAAGQHRGSNPPASRSSWPTQQLYLGQRPTDGGHLAEKSRRPTSFQPALTRCSGGNGNEAGSISSSNEDGYGRRHHGDSFRQIHSGSSDWDYDVAPSGGHAENSPSFIVAFVVVTLTLSYVCRSVMTS